MAEAIHYYEALLATLAVVLWHFYFVIFNPEVYPMNWGWWDGKVPLEWVQQEREPESLESGEEVSPQPSEKRGRGDPSRWILIGDRGIRSCPVQGSRDLWTWPGFSPMPDGIREEMVFLDRIYFLPSWVGNSRDARRILHGPFIRDL